MSDKLKVQTEDKPRKLDPSLTTAADKLRQENFRVSEVYFASMEDWQQRQGFVHGAVERSLLDQEGMVAVLIVRKVMPPSLSQSLQLPLVSKEIKDQE